MRVIERVCGGGGNITRTPKRRQVRRDLSSPKEEVG